MLNGPRVRRASGLGGGWLGDLCLLAMVAVVPACEASERIHRAAVEDGLLAAFATRDEVDVIVSFADPAPHRRLADREGHRLAIAELRAGLLLAGQDGFTPTRSFHHVPALAGRITRAALARLSRQPEVSFIQVDSPGHGALTVSVPAIGADVAKSDFHVTGRGVRVAVLDTGANTTHPDLKSSIAPSQHCFTRNACPPNNTAEGTSAEDDHGHGSHVSGIITSDGTVAGVGFAPDAEIVTVKINDRDSSGLASDWAAGLDWVFDNLATLPVGIVNASIGTDMTYASAADCDRAQPALARAVDNLIDAGVVVFASSGNAGSATQVSAPACNTGVIAVGATYKSNQGRQPTSGTYAAQWGNSFGDCADATTVFDKVTCFTNSGPRLDLVAPGAVIVSDSLGVRTESYRGTSQASPTAAGVAALMRECNPALTPAQIKDILVRTGVAVTDPKNGSAYPSIRAAAAVKEACAAQPSADGGPGDGSADAAAETARPPADGSDLRRPDGSAGDGGETGGAGSGGRTGSGGAGAGGRGGTSGRGGTEGGAGTGGTAGSSGAGGSGTGGATNRGSGGAGENASTGGRGGAGGSGGTTSGQGGAGGRGSVSTVAVTTGGAPGSGGRTGTGTDESAGRSSSGCDCRLAGAPGEPGRSPLWGFLALLAFALARRSTGMGERSGRSWRHRPR